MHQIACHECDLVQLLPLVPERASAICARCGSTLFRTKADSINRTLAWTFAGLVFFMVAITFPFMEMRSEGFVRRTDLLTGIYVIYGKGMTSLSFLVLITCVLAPLIQMLGLLFVFVPLKFNRCLPSTVTVFRLFQQLQPWSMMEVFMLGILVSWVKLGNMAVINPGLAVFSFALLIFSLTAAISAVDSHLVWSKIGALADE